jgi:hemoglobin
MAQARSTSITRRSVVAGLALTAAPVALAGADNAYAQDKQTTPEKSLYERLGGVFAIASVVDHFSDAIVKNPIVGQKSNNLKLREWHTKNLGRLPGLKFMRTLWVCNVSGGPFQFTATKPGTTSLGLEEAHRDLRISPQNSMRSQLSSDGPLASSRSRSPRRPKSWQPSPPTKTRSPPATSRPLSAAETVCSRSSAPRAAICFEPCLNVRSWAPLRHAVDGRQAMAGLDMHHTMRGL